ncbi:integral membrane [Fusarium agapanthi]|uniref:aldehyde dehydrogenase (NAD(+)) n=1 Tax=Fusarium agapanthi TaxID=1803897 RepID=A0A9P5AWU3_9HYPO|nr:integral membrane [Fusarium agapanthi]
MASVQPPNPLPPDQNVGPILLGISGTCLALVIITTSVRVWVRTALRSSGWDDYTIAIVTLLGVARFGVQVGQVSIGNGRHRWFIEPEDYVQNNKLGWVAQILLFAMFVIWNTSLPFKTKISVWALMSLGLVATGFGIARAASLGVVTSDLSSIWSNLELYLGIVGANLALSRSIFSYFFREGGTTKGSSYAADGSLVTDDIQIAGPEAVDAAVDAAPSEKRLFANLALGKLTKAANFPPGVFQILTGDGSTGSLLSHHMRVKKVSFTGSVPIGEKILAAAAATNLKRVKGMVDLALKQVDGKLLTSGNRVGDKGFWFPPTAFIEVVEESEIKTKENFGPVYVIMKFKEGGEVIARAINSEYGLALVFSQRHQQSSACCW